MLLNTPREIRVSRDPPTHYYDTPLCEEKAKHSRETFALKRLSNLL